MNKKLLKKLQARHEQRLTELRGQIESGEVREADLESVQNEIDTLIDELKDIKDELDEDPVDPPADPDGTEGRAAADDDDPVDPPADDPEAGTKENRDGMITQEQRDGLLGNIKKEWKDVTL